MSEWSAIVYGRTYEVDYRLIAIPEDFRNQEQKWALNYIKGTARTSEALPGRPRWSLFKNKDYCVVGVTCMARELIANSKYEFSEEMTKDSVARPLYLFVGYVARPPFPPIPSMNFEFFSQLYNYVEQRWTVKSYQEASSTPISVLYEEQKDLADSELRPSKNFDPKEYEFKADKQKAFLWLDTEEERKNLWFLAEQQAIKSPEDFSLCLGLANQKDALDSPFENVIVANFKDRISLNRVPPSREEKPLSSKPISVTAPAKVSSESTNYQELKQQKPSELEIVVTAVGMAVGGTLGWKIAGGLKIAGLLGFVPGLVIGGGLGWMAASWITDETNGTTSYDRESQTRHQSSSSQREKVDLGYGFKTKSQPNSSQEAEKEQQKNSNWF